MQYLYRNVIGCVLCTVLVLVAIIPASSTSAESNQNIINNSFRDVRVSNLRTMRSMSVTSLQPVVRLAAINVLPGSTQPQQVAQVSTGSDSAETEAPTPTPKSNMIAFWHMDEATIATNNNGTWRVNLIVRAPTSYLYSFESEYLASVKRTHINFEGDDIYTLTFSGMRCGQTTRVPLSASHHGLEMEVRNEFSYTLGPIPLSPPC